ncbi:MAG: alpha/beta hydrolase family protein [Thermomicrobiales bacterium]
MTGTHRITTLTFPTQEYVSRQYGDARIDCYVTEPARGVSAATGFLLLIHGWGNDGRAAYEADSIAFADTHDLVVTRVEYRHSGREVLHPEPGLTFDRPYDFSKLQTIDCLRAAKATLDHYPVLDRRRMILWGGSQGAHIAAQCLVFAPSVWSAAILCCGLYHPYTYKQQWEAGYAFDIVQRPGFGFVEYALGPGRDYPEQHEVEIRSPRRNAALMPAGAPIAVIHGTRDDNVDIRHAVELYARLLALGKSARFAAIANGDHGLTGAEAADEDSRFKATQKYASDLFALTREANGEPWPTQSTVIPVTGGRYEVHFEREGAALRFDADTDVGTTGA